MYILYDNFSKEIKFSSILMMMPINFPSTINPNWFLKHMFTLIWLISHWLILWIVPLTPEWTDYFRDSTSIPLYLTPHQSPYIQLFINNLMFNPSSITFSSFQATYSRWLWKVEYMSLLHCHFLFPTECSSGSHRGKGPRSGRCWEGREECASSS